MTGSEIGSDDLEEGQRYAAIAARIVTDWAEAEQGLRSMATRPTTRKEANNMPTPQLKDEEMYESLREDGASKEKAARISNAAAKEGRSKVGERGGEAEDYEDRTVGELRDRAKELGLTGYSKLRKAELIKKLRNH